MGHLILRFRGVNAFVPLTNSKAVPIALAVIMPNAIVPRDSRRSAPGSGANDTHYPTIKVDRGHPIQTPPIRFCAKRLKFKFERPKAIALAQEVKDRADHGWLKLDTDHFDKPEFEDVSGQCLIETGAVSLLIPPRPEESRMAKRKIKWSNRRSNHLSLRPVIWGLQVEIPFRNSAYAILEPFDGSESSSYELGTGDYELTIGNLCASDLAGFPTPLDSRHFATDEDFNWLYNLTKPLPPSQRRLGPPFDSPKVACLADEVPEEIESITGPVSGSACECHGLLDRAIAITR